MCLVQFFTAVLTIQLHMFIAAWKDLVCRYYAYTEYVHTMYYVHQVLVVSLQQGIQLPPLMAYRQTYFPVEPIHHQFTYIIGDIFKLPCDLFLEIFQTDPHQNPIKTAANCRVAVTGTPFGLCGNLSLQGN